MPFNSGGTGVRTSLVGSRAIVGVGVGLGCVGVGLDGSGVRLGATIDRSAVGAAIKVGVSGGAIDAEQAANMRARKAKVVKRQMIVATCFKTILLASAG